jgi:hypothetical protein
MKGVFMFKQFTAALTGLLGMAGLASGQYMGFTGLDITSMYNSWAAGQNAAMDYQTQQIIGQVYQDPRFQSMYQQYLASGGTASREHYAYSYAATGGFTPQGMQIYQNSEMMSAAKIQTAWQGYQNAVQGYRDAYGNYTGGFSNNMNEAGNTLMGNSTYVNPNTGSSYVLPHTWQRQSYYMHNGQTYYVDHAEQYFWVDPNNTSWMYPLYQRQ